jgi:hypothetical protein
MKKLTFFLCCALAILSGVTLTAQGQTPAEKSKIINIDAKGGIYDHGGTKLGFIDKDNIVRNNKGQKIYFIDKDGNVVSANGKVLGKAKKNGNYYNLAGETILTVKDPEKERCAILDPVGHNMGTVHQNYKLHACAAHCFFLEQEKKNVAIKKTLN